MKKIPLSQGKVAIVDDEDFDWISKFKWCVALGNKQKPYAIRGRYKNGTHLTIRMHREILDTPKGIEGDHINGDTLDNRRANLRNCTKLQNSQNRLPQNKKIGKYKGVTWDSESNKWRAKIRYKRKLHHIGYFVNEIMGASAYDLKAKELFGEFARLNFKREDLS